VSSEITKFILLKFKGVLYWYTKTHL
jgi:hypothetical protein